VQQPGIISFVDYWPSSFKNRVGNSYCKIRIARQAKNDADPEK
jgi:hypothetical protein